MLPRQQRRRPHLVITIHADTLLDHDDLPADLAGYGAITAQAARDLARHAGTADLLILGHPLGEASIPPQPGVPGTTAPEPNAPKSNAPERSAPESGAPADSPADRYRPGNQLVRDVIAHNPTCRAPGCQRRAEQCDIDHLIPHAQGGPTELGNLIPQCRFHHRLKTFGGWQPTPHPAGPDDAAPAIGWTSPTGRHYVVPPDDRPGTTYW